MLRSSLRASGMPTARRHSQVDRAVAVRSSKYVVIGVLMSMTALALPIDAGMDAPWSTTKTTTDAAAGGWGSGAVVRGLWSEPDFGMNSPYATFAAAKAAFPNTSYVDVPAGDNSGLPRPGLDDRPPTRPITSSPVCTRSVSGEFAQIIPKNNDAFVGAPGAILDGRDQNAYTFTQHATGVKIEFLEIRHFVSPLDQGVVNHDAGTGWGMAHNYMHDNGGAAMFLGDRNTAQYNCLDHNSQYGFQIFGDTVTCRSTRSAATTRPTSRARTPVVDVRAA